MRTCEVEMFDGKVACPYSRAGSVDVETCYRCPRLRAFYDEESGTNVARAWPLRVRLVTSSSGEYCPARASPLRRARFR